MDPKKIYAKDGVCKALEKAKKDGLTRFLGVSGHNRPARFLQALKEWDFDVMMNAVSLVSRHIYDFESKVWPEAAQEEGGAGGDEGLRRRGAAQREEPQGARLPDELKPAALRYALGLPQVSTVVVGIHDDEELKQNLAWVKDYKPLGADELKKHDAEDAGAGEGVGHALRRGRLTLAPAASDGLSWPHAEPARADAGPLDSTR